MRLAADECRRRLLAADHGVLATRHPERGVDAVPVCFAIVGDDLAVPVDRVKPKASTELQRQANLDLDGRAVLLVERWDPDDWSRLWWVQAHLVRVERATDRLLTDRLLAELRARYRQYRAPDAIAAVMTFAVARLSGWAAADSPP